MSKTEWIGKFNMGSILVGAICFVVGDYFKIAVSGFFVLYIALNIISYVICCYKSKSFL